MPHTLRYMPNNIELAGIIKDAADCLDGKPENYCSWSMANAAAEAVHKRLQFLANAAQGPEKQT